MRFLALFFIGAFAFAQPPNFAQRPSDVDRAPDVRTVSWGMSRAEVMAADPGWFNGPLNPSELAIWVTDLAKSDAKIVYEFSNDKLVRATYVFTPKHSDANDFVADFHAVTAQLVARHKQPSCERALWLDDSLQNERIAYLEQDRALPSDILPSDKLAGLSISVGHLRLYSTWEGPRTQILHTMTGENHQIAHRVEYRSVELFAANQPRDVLQAAQVCR